MPLLRRAEAVVVAGVAARDQAAGVEFEIDDVLANLKRNGVKARAVVTTAPDETVANELDRIARGNEADLIVTGAYGQSRLREWAFGGVTDDFLHRPNAFVLMSH